MMQLKQLLLAATLLIHSQSHSQLGSLLKKVKNGTGQTKENKPATNTSANSGNINKPVRDEAAVKEETIWELPSGPQANEFGNGGPQLNHQQLEREKPIDPYQPIRKLGETGCFHFAKDYPELQDITTPENKNILISFSSAPYNGGTGTPATSFNSGKSHIYARLKIGNGSTLKEVFKLSGDVSKISVDYAIYPDGADIFTDWSGLTFLYIRADQYNQTQLDFDIMPDIGAVTAYIDPADRYSFYLSAFPQLHDARFFTKNGNYKIAIKAGAAIKDDWGNPTQQRTETMSSFEYVFAASDAARILDEGQKVMKALQSGIRYTPKPLIKEWKMASAAPAVAGYTASKYNQLYSNFYKGVTIVKTYLSPKTASLWKVIMSAANNNQFPEYKYCTQWVTYFVKDAAGRCYYHTCNLRQDYTGGGTYGDTYLAVFDAEIVYVNCAEMK